MLVVCKSAEKYVMESSIIQPMIKFDAGNGKLWLCTFYMGVNSRSDLALVISSRQAGVIKWYCILSSSTHLPDLHHNNFRHTCTPAP